MKIRTEFVFDDQDEFISFFQNWFEKQPETIIEEPITDTEVTERPDIEKVIEKQETPNVSTCLNPNCNKDFQKGTSGFAKYCSKQCYMAVYWSKRTKDKDGKVILREPVSEDHIKELLKRCKETGIPPVKEPEYSRTF